MKTLFELVACRGERSVLKRKDPPGEARRVVCSTSPLRSPGKACGGTHPGKTTHVFQGFRDHISTR